MSRVTHIFAVLLAVTAISSAYAQIGNNKIREGNSHYESEQFDQAQKRYEESLAENPNSVTAAFNLANSYYKQEKYEEAAKLYQTLTQLSEDRKDKAKAYHNLGNSLFKSKKVEESVEAYKNALRNNPMDEDTRYNLSMAMHKQEQEEQQQDQDQDKQDQDKKDQDKKDQEQKQDQQKQDQEKNEQEQQDQQQKEEEQQKQEQQQQQPRPDELSKEDAERLLNALKNEERDTKDKLKKKAKARRIDIEKDW